MKHLSFRSFFRLSGLVFCSLLLPRCVVAQNHRDPVPVDFSVICDDAPITEKLTALIQAELQKDGELVRDRQLPSRKLFLYAQHDVNDRKNPDSWSFAIAHVSNLANQVLAARVGRCVDPQCLDARKLAYSTLKEEGLLKHLNVAHIDDVTDAALSELVGSVFATFAQRAKGQ